MRILGKRGCRTSASYKRRFSHFFRIIFISVSLCGTVSSASEIEDLPLVRVVFVRGNWQIYGKKRIVQIFADGTAKVQLWCNDGEKIKKEYKEESKTIVKENIDELKKLIKESQVIEDDAFEESLIADLEKELVEIRLLLNGAKKANKLDEQAESYYISNVIKPKETDIALFRGELPDDIDEAAVIIHLDNKTKGYSLSRRLTNDEAKYKKLQGIVEEVDFLVQFNDCGCCCGNSGQDFWVDKTQNKIVGVVAADHNPCSSKITYYFLGEHPLEWKNQKSIQVFSPTDLPTAIQKRRFENLLAEYNTRCGDCLQKVQGEYYE